jgi:hypothetical protein
MRPATGWAHIFLPAVARLNCTPLRMTLRAVSIPLREASSPLPCGNNAALTGILIWQC